MACGGIDARNVRVCAYANRRPRNPCRVENAESIVRSRYRNENISLGTVKGSEYQRFVVLKDDVQRLLRAASASQTIH